MHFIHRIYTIIFLYVKLTSSTWRSKTGLQNTQRYQTRHILSSHINRFALFSSVLSIPPTNSSYSHGNVSGRSAFNLTGVVSGDEFQCSMPNREFRIDSPGISFHGPSSHQVLMKWHSGPHMIFLLCKPDDDVYKAAEQAVNYLHFRGLKVFVEQHVFDKLSSNEKLSSRIVVISDDKVPFIDLIVAFGGDGLLMYCNTLFNTGVPPTMCFDFGSLGFLAPFDFHNFKYELDKVLKGSVLLTLRMRLQCTVLRGHQVLGVFHVLNEAVIDRGPSPYLSTIDLRCDGQTLTTVQGDGIIIATPTGSTAYSLAAGGSMVHPSVPAILLTPICAHSLSFRPLLLPDSCIITAEVPEDGRSTSWVSFDGKFRQELLRGDKLEVKMSAYPLPTVNRLNFTGDWFDALRSAFMFNERPRQKPFNMNNK